MTVTLEAVIHNGQLQLKEPLALAEGTPVRVAITPMDDDDPFEAVIGICDSGPPISLAERHDEFLYGIKHRPEGQS